MRYAAGVEFPGIILMNKGSYEKPVEIGLTITTAHEVAHQWWYNTVGNDIFNDPWLDEALATYSSGVYIEQDLGDLPAEGLLNYWQARHQKLVESGKDDLVTNSLDYFESLNDPGVYSGVVYVKGALFFDALRAEIGDEAFFTALKQYYDRKSFQVALPADLLDLFEKTSGPVMLDFRALRFPGLVSAFTLPSGGTSDYGPEMLHAAAQGKSYSCFVRPDTRISFMAMPDAIKSLLMLMDARRESLSSRVYNVAAFAITAEDFRQRAIRAFPGAMVTFDVNPRRQGIVDSWPEDVDDGRARKDWGWKPEYDVDRFFDDYFLPEIRKRYGLAVGV